MIKLLTAKELRNRRRSTQSSKISRQPLKRSAARNLFAPPEVAAVSPSQMRMTANADIR